jgi:uncharacterized protein (UPF0264 family)
MSLMLASVSDAVEAELALACGVDWIDVKDPRRGALGDAEPAVVREIVRRVGGRTPVSATLGDTWYEIDGLAARVARMAATGVSHLKIGLAARDAGPATIAAIRSCAALHPGVVVVCMAEHAPAPDDVRRLAGTGIAGVMLDTADTAGRRLPELLALESLAGFVRQARAAGVLSGLAGRLRREDVAPLVGLAPDYLGFRSALCVGGARAGGLVAAAVCAIRDAVRSARGSQQVHSEVA